VQLKSMERDLFIPSPQKKENTRHIHCSIICHFMYLNLQKGIQIISPALLAFYGWSLSCVVLASKKLCNDNFKSHAYRTFFFLCIEGYVKD
jgi:hypothetical protein